MKFISFEQNGNIRLGAIENELIYDLHSIDNNISNSIISINKILAPIILN